MSDLFERILLLKKSAIFHEVSTEDLAVVAQALEEERYFGGEKVFRINHHGDHMYIVEKGRVGISLKDQGEEKNYIAVLSAGDCFGEMNLLDELPRSATAHVMEDALLLSLEKSRLRRLIFDYPQLAMGMLKGLSLRVRKANLLTEGGRLK